MTTAMKITKRTIDALDRPQEGRTVYRDTEDPYLHIVLTPSAATWRYIRKWNGSVLFLTIGRYPDTTPEQARQESRKASAKITMGEDPRQQRRAIRECLTWGDVFKWYMEEHAKPHKRTWRGDEWQEKRYCAGWGRKPWTSISKPVVTTWHNALSRKHGKFAADRALALVRCVFYKALRDGVIKGENPAAGVRMNYTDPEQYGRDRFLTRAELPRLFNALDKYPDQSVADIFRLCLFTGARKGNVSAMRWQDFDRTENVWTIPGEVHKNGTPVKVPLILPALEVLNRRHAERTSEEWAFPSKRRNPKKPHMTGARPAWLAICKSANIEGVRIHDLRRTMGSWQALTGASLKVIGESLGHRNAATTQIYARLTDDAVRDSMDKAATAMIEASKAGEA